MRFGDEPNVVCSEECAHKSAPGNGIEVYDLQELSEPPKEESHNYKVLAGGTISGDGLGNIKLSPIDKKKQN
jgi:hypothetical protein